MTSRDTMRADFLASTDWHDAQIIDMTPDASARSYARLSGGAGRAVLMDAPPDLDLKTDMFMRLAGHLNNIGLSAPKILAANPALGFLILEDLGEHLVYDRTERAETSETALYTRLCDVALHLWANPPKFELPRYDAGEMTAQMDLFADWYCTYTQGSDPQAARDLIAQLSERIASVLPDETGLIHRDYHVQNLLFVPTRNGLASIGILDFQDAMLGPQAYDIASLLTDARQDVPARLRQQMLGHCAQVTGRDLDGFSREFALCALQRNLRIIGIFARLSLRDGKRHYPALLPRVFGYIDEALSHPALSDLAALFTRAAAAPAADVIRALQTREVAQ